MSMSEQFDLLEAAEQRDAGIQQVAENNKTFLERARQTARLVCQAKGTVTSDDVRKGCPLVPKHPNAWGAVFKGKEFEFTGERRKSEIVSRHSGEQKVWRLKRA